MLGKACTGTDRQAYTLPASRPLCKPSHSIRCHSPRRPTLLETFVANCYLYTQRHWQSFLQQTQTRMFGLALLVGRTTPSPLCKGARLRQHLLTAAGTSLLRHTRSEALAAVRICRQNPAPSSLTYLIPKQRCRQSFPQPGQTHTVGLPLLVGRTPPAPLQTLPTSRSPHRNSLLKEGNIAVGHERT